MEVIVKSFNVHDNGCIGCEKMGKDIMLTIVPEGRTVRFLDFFLTSEQAQLLLLQLAQCLKSNGDEVPAKPVPRVAITVECGMVQEVSVDAHANVYLFDDDNVKGEDVRRDAKKFTDYQITKISEREMDKLLNETF